MPTIRVTGNNGPSANDWKYAKTENTANNGRIRFNDRNEKAWDRMRDQANSMNEAYNEGIKKRERLNEQAARKEEARHKAALAAIKSEERARISAIMNVARMREQYERQESRQKKIDQQKAIQAVTTMAGLRSRYEAQQRSDQKKYEAQQKLDQKRSAQASSYVAGIRTRYDAQQRSEARKSAGAAAYVAGIRGRYESQQASENDAYQDSIRDNWTQRVEARMADRRRSYRDKIQAANFVGHAMTGFRGARSGFQGIGNVYNEYQSLSRLSGGSGMGRTAMIAGLAGGLGYAAIRAPSALADIGGSLLDGSSPYMNLQGSAAALGRRSGVGSSAYMNQLYGRVAPSWLSRLGLGGQDALNLYNARGAFDESAGGYQTDIKDIVNASRSTALGGLGNERYAQMSGYAQTMGLSTDQYFQKMQKAMFVAQREGLDHSRVADTMQNMLSQNVANGLGLNAAGKGNVSLFDRMVSSGSASARSGEGVLSLSAGLSAQSTGMGIGGNWMNTLVAQNYVNSKGGLKALGTREGAEKILGVKYGDLTGDQRKAFDDTVAAARGGNALYAYRNAGPLIGNDKQMEMNQFAIKSGMLPGGYKEATTIAALTGTNNSTANSYLAGHTSGNSQAPMVWGSASRDMNAIKDALSAASARTGIPVSILASQANVETGFKNFRNTKGGGFGAAGLGQIRKPALDQLHKMGMDLDIRGPDDLLDPEKGARAQADYLQYLYKKTGNYHDALAQYHDGGKVGKAGRAYADQIMAGSGGFAWQQQMANENDMSQAGKLQAQQQNREIIAGQTTYDTLLKPFNAAADGAQQVGGALLDLVKSIKTAQSILNGPMSSTHVNGGRKAQINGKPNMNYFARY